LAESDAKHARVLEIGLRKAGYAVSVAPDGHEAMRLIETRPFDLVVCATDLSGIDGFALCEQAHGRPQTRQLPFVFVAERNTRSAIEDRVRGLKLGVEDTLFRPVYLEELSTRVRVCLQNQQRARLEMPDDVQAAPAGSLQDIGIIDFIQAIAVSNRSGVFHITSHDGRRGALYFRDGRIVDAEAGMLFGADAVYRLFAWSEGHFEVEFKTIRRRDLVELSPQALLMEGMRRHEEWSRMLRDLPRLETVFEVDCTVLSERLASVPDEANQVLRLFDGRRPLRAIIDATDLPDLEAVSHIVRLLREGIVQPLKNAGEPERAPLVDQPPGQMERWLRDQGSGRTAEAKARADNRKTGQPGHQDNRQADDPEINTEADPVDSSPPNPPPAPLAYGLKSPRPAARTDQEGDPETDERLAIDQQPPWHARERPRPQGSETSPAAPADLAPEASAHRGFPHESGSRSSAERESAVHLGKGSNSPVSQHELAPNDFERDVPTATGLDLLDDSVEFHEAAERPKAIGLDSNIASVTPNGRFNPAGDQLDPGAFNEEPVDTVVSDAQPSGPVSLQPPPRDNADISSATLKLETLEPFVVPDNARATETDRDSGESVAGAPDSGPLADAHADRPADPPARPVAGQPGPAAARPQAGHSVVLSQPVTEAKPASATKTLKLETLAVLDNLADPAEQNHELKRPFVPNAAPAGGDATFPGAPSTGQHQVVSDQAPVDPAALAPAVLDSAVSDAADQGQAPSDQAASNNGGQPAEREGGAPDPEGGRIVPAGLETGGSGAERLQQDEPLADDPEETPTQQIFETLVAALPPGQQLDETASKITSSLSSRPPKHETAEDVSVAFSEAVRSPDPRDEASAFRNADRTPVPQANLQARPLEAEASLGRTSPVARRDRDNSQEGDHQTGDHQTGDHQTGDHQSGAPRDGDSKVDQVGGASEDGTSEVDGSEFAAATDSGPLSPSSRQQPLQQQPFLAPNTEGLLSDANPVASVDGRFADGEATPDSRTSRRRTIALGCALGVALAFATHALVRTQMPEGHGTTSAADRADKGAAESTQDAEKTQSAESTQSPKKPKNAKRVASPNIPDTTKEADSRLPKVELPEGPAFAARAHDAADAPRTAGGPNGTRANARATVAIKNGSTSVSRPRASAAAAPTARLSNPNPSPSTAETPPLATAADCQRAYKRRRYDQIVLSCSEALQSRPGQAPLMAMIAHAELDRGRVKASISWAQKAVNADPELADAYVFLGGAQQQLGDVAAARSAYEAYLRLEPRGPFAPDLRVILKNL